MELTRYLRVLRQRLWMIVVCPLLAAITAGIVSFLVPPIYEVKVDLAVRSAQVLPSTDPNAPSLTNASILATYALWIKEPSVLNQVIADLGLKITPDDLAKEIQVTPDTVATVLHISVQDTNPTLAKDIATALVTDFKATVNQVQQTETQAPDNLVPLSTATVPNKPVSPNKALNVAIAFAAGLLLAVGVAFLLDYLDQSIKSDDDLVQRLGLIPIGHIAYDPGTKVKRGELLALDLHSTSAEAFKALRTGILFSTIDQALKAIVITSAELGEGKSRTAANLAIAMAQAGHRTLLIDADFRRPSQHRLFGKVRNIGLSNLILEDATEHEAITQVEDVPNLWLLPSGSIPPNPSELLGSARMMELMSNLWQHFSYVILDTPPVNAVTDASILAAAANATILIIEQGRTSWPALTHAKLQLDRVKANVIGVVVNKVHPTSGSYYYGYGDYGTPSTNGQALREGKRAPQGVEEHLAEG